MYNWRLINKGNSTQRRQLSQKEMDDLRAQNKCFRCREVGHMSKDCPSGQSTRPPAIKSHKVSINLKELQSVHNSVRGENVLRCSMASLAEGSEEEEEKSFLDRGIYSPSGIRTDHTRVKTEVFQHEKDHAQFSVELIKQDLEMDLIKYTRPEKWILSGNQAANKPHSKRFTWTPKWKYVGVHIRDNLDNDSTTN